MQGFFRKIEEYIKLYTFNPYNDLPKRIYLEITGVCNLKCPNCARTYSNRKRGHMNDDLFYSIVDVLSKEHPVLEHIGFHFFGEIIMKNNFHELIRYAKSKLPKTNFGISTNLSFNNDEFILKLLMAGFDSIGIWPDAISEDDYNKIRKGGDFASVRNNIVNLCKEREKLNLTHKIDIHIGIVRYKDSNYESFLKEYQFVLNYPNTRISQEYSHDFAGQIPNLNVIRSGRKACFYVPIPCKMPFETMIIAATGDISLCCYDMNLKLKIGTVNKNESIINLWASKNAEDIRKKIKLMTPPDLCRNCHNYKRDLLQYVQLHNFNIKPKRNACKSA